MSSAEKLEKRLFSEPNTSVSSEGILDSQSNQNLVEAIVCQNSDSVMSGMFECVNHSCVAESGFVMCGDNSNPDSVMNDVVPCSNDFSLAESDFLCMVRNKVHTSKSNQNANYVCLVCHGNFEKREIIFHFKNAHDIDMDHTELELNSFNDFLAWKAEIENNTKSKFISYSTKHINIHGVKYYYFRCHRSGNFMSESKGLRLLKILGSNKINAYCPAALKVTEHTDGKCIVSYQKVHVGHLFLTADERENIASKIAAKIPLDNILDEIRNSISDAGLERVHLLTKKDLHNIEKSFNLSSNSVKHENDGVSVDMWVREMQNSENPCILFYKTQGSTCTQYSFLKENDFVLIIMTEAQGEILKKFSSDCICIDGTHGVNGYGFELVTLLTIDDLRQGFPCAFLISNRCDQIVLSIFFSVY
ncbi:uncharacterized protein NPIL_606511 [Nephila pilipes]|uniref:C2H2-type domain-containing protein n=1 Tax=Nephila pilipes TaxID=299642 RepID=A0A8X6QQX7_NEPPI|nr:uncharacterized protein NPIL_606511 [Nephila pilipes]